MTSAEANVRTELPMSRVQVQPGSAPQQPSSRVRSAACKIMSDSEPDAA
jgi:hypothetical protein